MEGIGKKKKKKKKGASRSTNEWQIDFVRLLPFSTPSIRARGMRSISSRVINNIQRLVFPSGVASRKEESEGRRGGSVRGNGRSLHFCITRTNERTNEPAGVAGLGPQMEIPDLYANSIFVAPWRCQPSRCSSLGERTSDFESMKKLRLLVLFSFFFFFNKQLPANRLNEYYLGSLLIVKVKNRQQQHLSIYIYIKIPNFSNDTNISFRKRRFRRQKRFEKRRNWNKFFSNSTKRKHGQI